MKETEPKPPPSHSTHRSILVAEDEKELRDILSTELHNLNCTVYSAKDGAEAWSLLKKHKIDVFISDIQMPQLSGTELIDRIRSHQIQIPVIIIMSGFCEMDESYYYARGVHAFLKKPVLLHQIAALTEHIFRTPPGLKKQKSPRYNVQAYVEFSPQGMDTVTEGILLNISESGMFLMAQSPSLNEGTPIEFKILTQHLNAVEIKGRGICRWSRGANAIGLPPGCGVEFTVLDFESRLGISALIQQSGKPLTFEVVR